MKMNIHFMKMNTDCIVYILGFIDDGMTYKSALLLSPEIYRRLLPKHAENVDRFSDHLATLVDMFPDLPWDWRGVASLLTNVKVIVKRWDKLHPHRLAIRADELSLDFVVKHNIWSLSAIAKFGRLLLPYVNPDDTHMQIQLYNEDDIVQNSGRLSKPMFAYLSQSSNISSDFIFANREYPWNWSEVSSREDLTEHQIKEYKDILVPRRLLYRYPIHRYGYFSLDGMIDEIILQKYITIEDIRTLAPNITDWRSASDNMSISCGDIVRNMDLPWDIECVMAREDLTFDEAMIIGGDDLLAICTRCQTDDDIDRLLAKASEEEKEFIIKWGVDLSAGLLRKYRHLYAPNARYAIEDIVSDINDKWDWETISLYLPVEDITKYPQLIEHLHWDLLTDHKTPKEIIDNPNLPWTSSCICAPDYAGLKWTHVATHLQKYEELQWV